MKPLATSVLVIALLAGGVVVNAVPFGAAAAAVAQDCTNLTDPFTVNGVAWGTPGSPVSAYPGEQNVPLTVTFLFSGPCSSPQTTFYLGLTQGGSQLPFVGPNGVQEPSVVDLNISPNTLVAETFYLDIDQNAGTGLTYYIPLIIVYSDNSVSSQITQTALATGGPLTAPIALYGQVELTFSADTSHVLGGGTTNVTVSITNSGAGEAGPVSTTVTAPEGVTLLNEFAVTPALPAGANYSQSLELFVSSSLTGTAFVLTFTAKYLDPYLNSDTVTDTLGFTVASSSAPVSSSSFVVEGANWGSAASSSSPFPGTQDTPLVVSLQYLGSVPVDSLKGALTLPAGFTDLNGAGTALAYSAATTNQYGALTLSFYLDIASTLPPGDYNFTLSLEWMTSQSSGLVQTAVLTPPPVASLESSFQVESASWGSSSAANASTSPATSPVPGASGEPLVVSLQYLGTTSVTSIEGTLTLPTGFTNLDGGQSATAFAATATPDQVVTLTFYLDIGSGVKPGGYSFPIEFSWLTSVSSQMTESGTVTPPPVSSPTSTSSYVLSVKQENSTVVNGATAPLAFVLTNGGTTAVYSPTFSLQIVSPLVLTSEGAAVPTTELAPGGNATFVADVSSGPTGTPGVYSGTLQVEYTDSSGTSHSQSFPVSFTVEGTVILVLQDTVVSQSTTGFTITGSILNEGTVAADYASISGVLGVSSATPVYLGEIDPNTPLPFSVTIPFTAPATIATNSTHVSGSSTSVTFTRSGSRSFNFSRVGNFSFPGGFGGLFNSSSSSSAATVEIALSLTYKDTFGSNRAQAFTVPTTVKTLSELGGVGVTSFSSSSSGSSTLQYVAYGVVAVLAVAVVGGALVLRRHRARAFASLPQEKKGEQSVI